MILVVFPPVAFSIDSLAAVTDVGVDFEIRVESLIRPLPFRRPTALTPASLLKLPSKRCRLIVRLPTTEDGESYSSSCAVVEFEPVLRIASIPAGVKGMSLASRFTAYAACQSASVSAGDQSDDSYIFTT